MACPRLGQPMNNKTIDTPSTAPVASPAPPPIVERAGLWVALAALVGIVLMPPSAGLPEAGQVMLGILAFAVVVWMTEALDYAVSAVVIGALMVFMLAFTPEAAKPAGPDMGTAAALGLTLSGFASSAVALVASAWPVPRRWRPP